MNIQGNVKDSVGVTGLKFDESVAIFADAVISQNVTVPAAQLAADWVLDTGGLTGTLTMVTGHTLQTGDVVDLFWNETVNGATVRKGRRGMTLGTVATDSVPVLNTTGAGDALPTAVTGLVITVGERVEMDAVFAGNTAQLIVLSCPKNFSFSLTAVGLAEEFGRSPKGGSIYKWYNGNGEPNPVAGDDITNCIVSNGETVVAKVQLGVMYENA